MADDVIAKHEKDSAEHIEDVVNDSSEIEKIAEVKEDTMEKDVSLNPNSHQSKKVPGVASRTKSQNEKDLECGNTNSTTNGNDTPSLHDGSTAINEAKDSDMQAQSVISNNETSTSKIKLSAPSKFLVADHQMQAV